MTPRVLCRRALAVPALAIVSMAAAAGCGGAPNGSDFAEQAEKFINGDLNEDTGLNGLTLSEADCDEPESTDTGTAFNCTATASDGQVRTLAVNITGRNEFTIVDIQPPVPAATTASSVPAATPTPTTAAG